MRFAHASSSAAAHLLSNCTMEPPFTPQRSMSRDMPGLLILH
jgi:hypothetical protein